MAGPWEDFQSTNSDSPPWEDFKAPVGAKAEAMPWEDFQQDYGNEGYKKPNKGGASSIPGSENSKQEKQKKSENSVIGNFKKIIDLPARFKEFGDIVSLPAAGVAGMAAGAALAPVQSAWDAYKGQPSNVFENFDRIAGNVSELRGPDKTEFGEEANKFLNENVYRHLPALGATGFHISPLAKQQATLARMRTVPEMPVKMGPMIPNELRSARAASEIGPQLAPEAVQARQAAKIGPIQPEGAKSTFVGPDKQLAELADVEQLRSIIGDDAVEALKARVAADNEMRQQNLTQLEELAKADAEKAAQERPNVTSQEGPNGQQALFEQGDQMGQRNQFNAGDLGDWRIDENGMPVRVDKSMEAANLGEPLQRNLWGDELGPAHGNDRSLTEAIDSLPAGAHRDTALERLQGAVEAPPELQRAMLEAEGHQFGNEVDNTTFQPTNPLPTQTVGEMGKPVELPLVNRGYVGREWAQQDPVGYSQALNNHVEAARIDPRIVDNIANPNLRADVRERLAGDKTVKAVAEYQPTAEPFSKEPVVATPSDTAPAVGVMNKIPGFTDKMRHIRPMMETAQQILEKFKDMGDISQNAVQRGINYVTKGSIYNGMRIDHPFYTKVTQRFRDADGNINAAIKALIHDKGGYADTLKKLSREEYDGLAQEVQQAWREERELTPEHLRSKGYSEQGITAMLAHQQFTDKMLNGYLRPAAELAGIKNVKQDISYYAGKTSGDFQKKVTIMREDANGNMVPEHVGTLASDTRRGLNKKVAEFQKLEQAKGTTIGPEEYLAGRRRSDVSQGASQFAQWLVENHPGMEGYVDIINQLSDDVAANYMGTKKHTMAKKGTFGTEGNDPTLGVHENGKAFWDSQVQYGENVIKWAEKSKAMADVQPLMTTPNRPNLNSVIKDYVDNSMGRNPTDMGKAMDRFEATVGEKLGMSPALIRNAFGHVKQATNIKLLATSAKFYWGNMTQQMARTPEMVSYLRSMGVDPSFLGTKEMTQGMIDALPIKGREKSQTVLDAEQYARDNHVYSSDLFDTNNRTRKTFGHYVDKLTVPAAVVEQYTRKSFYLTAVNALEQHGMQGNELFGTAKNLTDMFMNNYAKEESALSYQNLGKSGGSNSSNLMSFNNNEMSRLAMNINNAAKGDFAPLGAQLTAQIAMAGVMGVVGYKEADALVKWTSSLMGKPISLSLMLAQNEHIPELFKYGIPSVATGADLTSTGAGSVVQGLPGGSVMDVFAPGLSAWKAPAVAALPILGDIALKREMPKKYDMLKLIREVAPNGPAQGYMDRTYLSPKGENGNEMAMNQNTMTAQVPRNEADKISKSFGVTGLHEAVQKNKDYQLRDIETFYKQKRDEAIKDWSRANLVKSPKDAQAAMQSYFKNEGGKAFGAELQKAVKDGVISEEMRKLMASQGGDMPQAQGLLRRMAK